MAISSVDVLSNVESLIGFGLITNEFVLTEKGHDMANRLWSISNQQQEEIFADLTAEGLSSFKK